MAGSSASAAATAVSIAVRQRIPSAVAASRISAASRTAPGARRRRVDHEADLAVGDEIEDGHLAGGRVRRVAELGDRRGLVAGGGHEGGPGAGRGRQSVAGRGRVPRRGAGAGPCRGRRWTAARARRSVARPGRHERRAEQRLGERHACIVMQSDHLAGRLHPGPDRRVDAAQLGRREGRRLDRHERRRREQPAVPAELRERRPERDPHRQLDHRDAGDLGEERHRPRRARVDLDQVDAVVADDELGVDEALRAEREHDPLHRRDDQRLVALADGAGREDADRVARVDARPLDVLEQARDEDALAVGDRVDVDLDALEVAVDADRAGPDRRRSPPRAAGRGPRASSRSRSRARR